MKAETLTQSFILMCYYIQKINSNCILLNVYRDSLIKLNLR